MKSRGCFSLQVYRPESSCVLPLWESLGRRQVQRLRRVRRAVVSSWRKPTEKDSQPPLPHHSGRLVVPSCQTSSCARTASCTILLPMISFAKWWLGLFGALLLVL